MKHDIADLTLDPRSTPDSPITLLEMCGDCAFRSGTEANQYEITQIESMLCVELPEPFYCHHNQLSNGVLPEGEEHLCRGWTDIVSAKIKAGYYENRPQWKTDVFVSLSKVAEDFRGSKLRGNEIKAVVLAAVNEALAKYQEGENA